MCVLSAWREANDHAGPRMRTSSARSRRIQHGRLRTVNPRTYLILSRASEELLISSCETTGEGEGRGVKGKGDFAGTLQNFA